MIFGFGTRRIYADWAATTPVHPCVARAMSKTRALWANPSAIHEEGVRARAALEEARTACARILSAKPDEIYFTSGGTESNNLIIRGVIDAFIVAHPGTSFAAVHIVTTAIEHSSVLETVREFERKGAVVTVVGTNAQGIVSADEVISAIRPNTALVTCMLANNEIGTFQPVSKIGAGIRKIRADKVGERSSVAGVTTGIASDARFPIFHSDASQAPLWTSCDLEGLRVDALTLDAHKMQGPKGVGLLAVRHGIPFAPLMRGGGQEREKRPTTESVTLATGMAEALRIAHEGREKRVTRALSAQKALWTLLEKAIPGIILNGSVEKRIPNNINISLPDLGDAEFAVIRLDAQGIACSTKSSCLAGEESSYVVSALGGPDWRAKNTLRFSFSPAISASDIRRIALAVKALIL
jgi:cysteine desulfurase